jgi:hypothetical protein
MIGLIIVLPREVFLKELARYGETFLRALRE